MLHTLTGTDVLSGDPLGRFDISEEGIKQRDNMVWEHALRVAKAPIVMTLSGGMGSCYLKLWGDDRCLGIRRR